MRFVVGLCAGLVVSVAIAASNFYLVTSTGFDFSTMTFFALIPVGAMLMGIPAAFVFNVLGWSSRGGIWRGLVHLVLSMLLGAVTLGIYHFVLFVDLGLLDPGSSASAAFTAHFSNLTMSSRYGDYPMADWGVLLGIFSYAAASLGGLTALTGAALSTDTQQANAANAAKQVAKLAVLLSMSDGEIDDDDLACSRYVTKLALETLAERTFGVSKGRAISSLDAIFAEARNDIPAAASYAEIINECTSEITLNDKVFNNIVMYGLASVIAKTNAEDLEKDKLVLLAYIAERLGVANIKTSEVLGMGHALRTQILSGKMR